LVRVVQVDLLAPTLRVQVLLVQIVYLVLLLPPVEVVDKVAMVENQMDNLADQVVVDQVRMIVLSPPQALVAVVLETQEVTHLSKDIRVVLEQTLIKAAAVVVPAELVMMEKVIMM
tara:strand:+ start:70 stop:417 length:348 start_codon:yes stop_codon:yes gene_type:complete